MNNQQLLIAGCFIIPALVIIAITATRCAWHKGKQAGYRVRQAVEERLLTELRAANADLCSTVRGLNQRISAERSHAALAMELQQQRHDEELTAAKASGLTISASDLQKLQRMADKLNLSAAALHATNQHKDAREAKNLSSSGHRIVDAIFRQQFDSQLVGADIYTPAHPLHSEGVNIEVRKP
ncbi:MAG: hypothetical protein ACKVK5_10540 [Pseudomonadales bacterium]